jgi:hypothetical protein
MLPEIREDVAPADIKAIYAEMRRGMRLPLVNLIYRHLATIPGVLPHTWGWVREMMVSGDLEGRLVRMTQGLTVPSIAPFESSSLILSEADGASVKRVLEVYNRGNGLNVIALTAIKIGLHRFAVRRPAEAVKAGEPSPIPPLLKFSELKPDTADLVAKMAALHGGIEGVIPSLYLHLANWPEFLAAACGQIAPLLKDGSVERARRAAVAAASTEAKDIVTLMQGQPEVAGFPEQVLAVLDQFTTRVIPDMLPIGLALDRALRR